MHERVELVLLLTLPLWGFPLSFIYKERRKKRATVVELCNRDNTRLGSVGVEPDGQADKSPGANVIRGNRQREET